MDTSDRYILNGKEYSYQLNIVGLIKNLSDFGDGTFIYLNYVVPSTDVSFTPYNLKQVSFGELSKHDFTTISKHGVVHWTTSGSSFTCLNEWLNDYHHFKLLMQVNWQSLQKFTKLLAVNLLNFLAAQNVLQFPLVEVI